MGLVAELSTGRSLEWRWVHRLSRLLVTAILCAFAIAFAVWSLLGQVQLDALAYDVAAERLRNGRELYAPGSMNHADVYRYTPWFAVLWGLVQPWGGLLLLLSSTVACIYVTWTTRHALPVSLMLSAMLLSSMSNGNVHPLLVATILWSRDRWTGAVWVAIAASIKAVPGIYALVYLGRREWVRFAVSVGVMALTALPLLAFDLSLYPTDAGQRVILWGTPLYVPVVLVGCVLTVLCARTRYAWLVASAVVILAMPRFWPYDLAWLLVAAVPAHGAMSPRTPSRTRWFHRPTLRRS